MRVTVCRSNWPRDVVSQTRVGCERPHVPPISSLAPPTALLRRLNAKPKRGRALSSSLRPPPRTVTVFGACHYVLINSSYPAILASAFTPQPSRPALTSGAVDPEPQPSHTATAAQERLSNASVERQQQRQRRTPVSTPSQLHPSLYLRTHAAEDSRLKTLLPFYRSSV